MKQIDLSAHSDTSHPHYPVTAIVIGRNEGARLQACLRVGRRCFAAVFA